MMITVNSQSVLSEVWFVTPQGTLDEVNLVDTTHEAANALAANLGCKAFIRKLAHDAETREWLWGIFRYEIVTWGDQKMEPRKTVKSPVIDQAHMLAIMLGLAT